MMTTIETANDETMTNEAGEQLVSSTEVEPPNEHMNKRASSAEAARYRTRLRDTEIERDGLLAKVEGMQRAEVERLAEAVKLKPSALWAAGTDLVALLDESGAVDATKVDEAVAAARDVLGIEKPSTGPRAPREGATSERQRSSTRDKMADLVSGRSDD